MKLLPLITGCIFSTLCFSQQLKPEIKDMMGRTELNLPKSLMYSENNKLQKINHTSLKYELLDTFPEGIKVNIPKDWEKFDYRKHLIPNSAIVMLKGKNSTLNPKEKGLYLLTQDNMPCIVPDTKDIAAIPNLWKGKVEVPYPSTIPNPALPKIFTLPKDLMK